MTAGALLWLIMFGLFGGLFFGIALVVSFLGAGDLRELLSKSDRKESRR